MKRFVNLLLIAAMLAGCASTPATGIEDIYVLRSIREHQPAIDGWCDASKTGFEPFAEDAQRYFSFWSVGSRPEDGKVVDADVARVADIARLFRRNRGARAAELLRADRTRRPDIPR